jgi:uncharacterized protein (DUF4415 family)
MPESKRILGSNLARLDATTDEEIARQIAEDPDTAPELTEDFFEHAEVWHGNRYLGRGKDFREGGNRGGRPKGSGTKEMVTLRLDKDVLERFRAGGPGWQTRVNDALRSVAPGEASQVALANANLQSGGYVNTGLRRSAVVGGQGVFNSEMPPVRGEGKGKPRRKSG